MTFSQEFNPQNTRLEQRVNQLEDRQIDLRMAVSSLVETVNIHQANFETIQRNFEVMQRNMDRKFEALQLDMDRKFEEVHSEIKGLQVENRRILDYLLGQRDG